jgi:hypothetical protein
VISARLTHPVRDGELPVFVSAVGGQLQFDSNVETTPSYSSARICIVSFNLSNFLSGHLTTKCNGEPLDSFVSYLSPTSLSFGIIII